MRLHLPALSICSLLFLDVASLVCIAQPINSIQIAQAGNPKAFASSVDQIAAAVTVRIDAVSGGNGSGVIVGRQGQTYTVLTAEHVIGNAEQYELITPDGLRHALKTQQIKALPGLDLAVIQFSSDRSYQTATIGHYDVSTEDRPIAFLSGFPGTKDGTVPQRELSIGTVFPTAVTLFAAQNAYSVSSGRGLVYTTRSQPGMSGGPVFDQLGRVIGIHNASETQLEADSSGLVFPMHIGRSLGVPMRAYLGSGASSSALTIQTIPPPRLSQMAMTQVLDQVQVPLPEADVATDWLRYGNHLWRLRRFDEAVNATQKALQLDPTLYQAYYVQGLALSAQQRYQQSIAAFDAALKINPQFYDAWRQKAQSLSDLKQDSAALIAINRAIALQSNDAGLYLIQGNIHQSLGQLAAAQVSYGRSLALKPSAVGYLQRGVVLAGQEDYGAARADFAQAIALQPRDYFGYLARGIMASSFGSPQEAIADFSRAESLIPPRSPYLSLVLMSKGLGLMSLGQPEQAIAATTQAIQRYIPGESPEAAWVQSYLLRSLAYAQTKNLPLAIADVRTLIQRQPKNSELFKIRGGYYFQAQDPQRAILDFNRAIALDGTNAAVYQERGVAYQVLRQNGAAEQDFRRAIALLTKNINQQPNQISSATFYLSRAQAHIGLKNLGAAKQDILRAERLFTSRGISSGSLFETLQRFKQLFDETSTR